MKKYFSIICIFLVLGCKKVDVKPDIPAPPTPIPQTKTPIIVTDNVSSLSQFAVDFSGKLVDSGGAKITQLGILVDTVSMPTTTKNFNKFLVQQLNSDGTFSINVTHLPSNTTFYVRAFATNSFGTGYGNEIKFTSLVQKTIKGIINLTSQQQVNDFGANHYTIIQGSLSISGAVSNLSPLLGLSIIEAGFDVNGTLLKNFKGLDSLEIIGSMFPNGFSVERNTNLVNFSGLSKLKITRGYVQFSNNNSLVNFDGLDSYIAVSLGGLRIGECQKLKNLSGLNKLLFIGSDFYIINNPLLTDLTGLANLSTISGKLYITNNSTLQNLTGLEKVQSLSDGIEISDNPILNDLNALRNLNSIKSSAPGLGAIKISGNPLIVDLSAFNQILSVDNVFITNSKGLKSLTGLKNLQNITYVLHIENNPNLVNLSGLENIMSLSRLEIFDNVALPNLKGLNGLTKITGNGISISIARNNSFQSLTGLENLVLADGSIQIFSNSVLSDFCPLKKLFSKGYNQFFSATFNASNPSQKDVLTICP